MGKGVLAVISGFSGAGKGTILRELRNRYDNYAYSVSATTRAPRPGETDGKDYFFVSREKFEDMIEKNQLLEYNDYLGNYYGTPRTYAEQKINEGCDVLLEIEMNGGLQVLNNYPDAVLIFVTPSNAEELRNRLEKRGTETDEQIRNRLMQAVRECSMMPKYDYILVNDNLEEAVETLHNIIRSCRCRTENSREIIAGIQNKLRGENKS